MKGMNGSFNRSWRRRDGGPRRRLVASLVLLVLIGTAIYAAAGASAARHTQQTTISFQVWGTPTVAEKLFQQWQTTYPKDAKGTSLQMVNGGANDGDSVTKFRLELAAHSGVPDLVLLNKTEVPEFAVAGELTNLLPYIKSYLPGMTTAAKRLMTYNGGYLGVPYNINEKLWFYRKDLFAQAAIDPTKIHTMQQFIDAGKQLHAKFPNSYIWNIAASPQAYVLGELMSGNGSQVFNRKTGKFVVATDPSIRAAFVALAQLRTSGVVNTQFDDFSPQWQSGLADGTIASVPIGSWLAEFLPMYAPKLANQWGVTVWPSIGGDANGGGSEAGGPVFVVPKAAKNKAAAMKFVEDMFMTKTGSLLTYKSGAVPNVTAAQQSPAVNQDPYFGSSFIKAYQAASVHYKVLNYDPAALKEITILNNALDSFLASGSTDPTSYLQTAQQELTSQIGNPYKP
ncbi:MAG TPA: extracellular solute-binding protein [Gaiellaceae bacterium]|nr:extracellular solute-binding protein [Gaiellaceae bacterium]